MRTHDLAPILRRLCSELVEGASMSGDAYMLNTGDVGLLRSLDTLSAADASRASHEGATIAAHAEHVRYGISLMNRWAHQGGNPFADATWEAAWNVRDVDERQWADIRSGLREETLQWLAVVGTPREASEADVTGMVASIAHIAYHLGAIRQIGKRARGPKDGTYS